MKRRVVRWRRTTRLEADYAEALRWCKLFQTPKAGSSVGRLRLCRDVAQPGRALAWGARGRQFKSARPDHSVCRFQSTFPAIAVRDCRPRSTPTLRRSEAKAHLSGLRGERGKAEPSAVQICPSRPFSLSIPFGNYNKSVMDLVQIAPAQRTPTPKPEWLKARAPVGENYHDLKRLARSLNLHTVCESAHCPNIGECWHHKTATFMMLGNLCTRRCGFCAVPKGRPEPIDLDEPRRVAEAVAATGTAARGDYEREPRRRPGGRGAYVRHGD